MLAIMNVRESPRLARRKRRSYVFVYKRTESGHQTPRLYTNGGLGGALERRRGVQAAQEDFQRRRRRLEVVPEQLQVGACLAQAGDRQVGHAQRLLDVARQGVLRPSAGRLAVPGVADALGKALEPGDGADRQRALSRLGQQAID